MKTKIKYIISITLFILAFAYAAYIRFTNIDMTESRLLIAYWWQWLVISGIVIIGALILRIFPDNGVDE